MLGYLLCLGLHSDRGASHQSSALYCGRLMAICLGARTNWSIMLLLCVLERGEGP